jgi:hypothetical protein
MRCARHPLALAMLAMAVAVVGCGGTTDERPKVAAALQTALTGNDPGVLCTHALSAGLVARVYGDRERCLAVERAAAAAARQPGSAVVSHITVDGDRARALVVMRGGDQAGARGTLSVVRQGGDWRLDDLSTAFLRSEFSAGASSDQQQDGPVNACVGKRIAGLEDAALRRLALGAMGGRPEAQDQLQTIVAGCVAGLSVPSAGGAA